MAKFTNDDIEDLAGLLLRIPGKFAVLTGAGCSIAAGIPLANTLREQICTEYSRQIRNLNESETSDYGICMSKLSKSERENLLKPYLDNAKINWAHIALATLIDKKLVSRVLTFNFDNVLARACGLLGLYPAIYDFVAAPTKNVDYIATPSIVHLHGQGTGMAMLNTQVETESHAENIVPLLEDTFTKFNLIVVGYSGLADKVYSKIIKHYKGNCRLIWLGKDDEPREHLKTLVQGPYADVCSYIGGALADEFLIKLVQKLECFPPNVFADPAGHLLSEMKDIVEFPFSKDFDLLADARNRLMEHQSKLLLEKSRAVVLRNKPEAPPQTGEIGSEDVPLKIQAWTLIERGNKHIDEAKKTNSISEYEKSIQYYVAALKVKPDMYVALNNWGSALTEIGLLRRDTAVIKASFDKFEETLKIKPDYHDALNNYGTALSAHARLSQDPALYEASFVKYAAAIKSKPDDFNALYNWGLALSRLADLKKEPALFEASFAKYEAVLKINPDDYGALHNWQVSLLRAWRLTKDAKYLEKASKVISQGEKINPDKCYMGACLAAIKNDEESCKERLLRAAEAKTLPSRRVLENDEDLANMRDKPWFAELLKDL